MSDTQQTDQPGMVRDRPREPVNRPRSPQDALKPADPPPPPKRSRQARNGIVVFFNFLMTLLVVGTLGLFATFYFGKLRFEEAGPLQSARTVVVKEGSSLARIAEQLEAAGVIDNEMLFRLGVRGYGAAGDLKPGEYAFTPAMSMYDVMEAIRTGKGILYKITFPEGLTSYQIVQRLKEDPILEGDLPAEIPPEGTLLPDTYAYQRGATRAEILNLMRRAQENLVAETWRERIDGLPLKSPEEMVTLASIVEKETGRADERPRVAAVFINRLNQGMRLQSDPTILYGIFGGVGRPADRAITRTDIDTPTPYNTYTINGLPPGPIANPGRAALEAVSNPSRTKELFFVADGTGGHVFAETLEEHNDNVKRWRAIEKRLREQQEKLASEKPAAGAADPAAATPQVQQ
ncbi:MAG TPA: endolytic transglycosylase MltG [Rhizobiaceae bacterium]|nr:endolytic transglycosylase MltG [Rhizobiaceae bacterium]